MQNLQRRPPKGERRGRGGAEDALLILPRQTSTSRPATHSLGSSSCSIPDARWPYTSKYRTHIKMAEPDARVVNTTSSSKEDVLDDGSRVIHTTTIDTYTDGSQCKRTVTRKVDTSKTKEHDLGHSSVSLSFRNVGGCCCFVPWGAWKKKKDEEEEEKEETNEESKEEAKEEES